MIPASAQPLTHQKVRVLNAVAYLHERDGRVTINSLVEVLGNARSTIHAHLLDLRRYGLVDWVPGEHGTLHPIVRRVDAA